MRRFTKMLALGLAAALVFGMAAQAAGSKDTSDEPGQKTPAELQEAATIGSTTVKVDGKDVEVKFEAPKALTEQAVKEVRTAVAAEKTVAAVQAEAQKAAQTVLKPAANQKVEFVGKPAMVAAMEVAKPAGLTDEQIAKGVPVPFTLNIRANMMYIVIHMAAGVPEVLPTEVKDGKVWATFTSFSPVVIMEQEVKVVTTADNSGNSGSQAPAPAPASTPAPNKSPVTGEAFPAAGMMALALLAGAALCARKARSSR